jgi:hypothetical protein
VSAAAVIGFLYTAGAVLLRGVQVQAAPALSLQSMRMHIVSVLLVPTVHFRAPSCCHSDCHALPPTTGCPPALLLPVKAVAARPDHWAGVALWHTDVRSLYAISIVVFGFNCHANVVSVFAELADYPHRLISRLPAE